MPLLIPFIETLRTDKRGEVNNYTISNGFHLHAISFPDGVLNCVPSLGSVGGAALSFHPGVDKV